MKNVGIVRSVDVAGRIVLPIENINSEDSKVEILAQGNEILIRKYVPSCIFCHETDDLIEFNGQKICKACAKKIGEATKK